ncbi:MAG: MlaD family protein [Gemmatimonadota bacterium]|nr:MlaD family protein [Gemmatimonadota bacterium]
MPDPGQLEWSDLRVGIVVASVSALALLAVFFAGAERGPFVPDTYTLYVEFDDAAGIRVGSPVRVAGVAAGEVASLEIVAPRESPPAFASDTLVPITDSQLDLRDIRIQLDVQERYRPWVTTSSRAQLASIGLGGERYVQIEAGDVSDSTLEPGATIPSRPSVDFDLLLVKLSRALGEMRAIASESGEIQGKLASGTGTLPRLADSTAAIYRTAPAMISESRAVLQLLEGGEGVVPRWLQEPEFRERVDRVAARVRDLVERIESGEGTLAAMAEPREFAREIASLERTIEELRRRLDRGRGTAGRLANDDELYLQIRILQRRIGELVAAFREDPLGFVDIDLF